MNHSHQHCIPSLKFLLQPSIYVFSIFILLTSLSLPAHAVTVYKAVINGIVTYTQLPPTDATDVEVIELRDDGRRNNTGQQTSQSETIEPIQKPTTENQRVAELEEELEQEKALEIAKQCERRREELRSLNSGGRIYELGDDGAQNYLDDREIELKRERVQKGLAQYCSG